MIKQIKSSKERLNPKRNYLKDFFLLLLIFFVAVVLAVLLRVFCFATFKIPTFSMEPTIEAGDHIFVNKMIPGPRLFADWRFFYTGNWEMKRCKGIRPLKRGEVVVFNFPRSNNNWNKIEMDFNVHYVKRIMGMPGDTLRIENGFYSVSNVSDTLGVYGSQLQLSLYPDSLMQKKVLNAFPHNKRFGWTIKFFGPLYIPRAGDKLRIDMNNLALYRKQIEYETGNRLKVSNDRIYLDEKLLSYYTFQQSYYFMAGDQVLNSKDSRYWGLLPEDHIIGRVSFIWKSNDLNTSKIRWNRILKKVK
jgi:signal peptidase I